MISSETNSTPGGIAHAALAHRLLAQQRAQLFVAGREFRRGDEYLAVGIGQRQAGQADALDIGIHVGAEHRADKTGAVGGGDQQVAQIGALRRLVRHLVDIALGQGQFRHVELERGVVGEALKAGILPLDPFVDGFQAAFRDDAHAQLPGAQVAVIFGIGKAENEYQADRDGDGEHHDTRQKANIGGQPAALGFAFEQVYL